MLEHLAARVNGDANLVRRGRSVSTTFLMAIDNADHLVRVAEGRYLSDELTLHFGLIPHCNRGIFAINELPDLAERIQVGLLNILEERDVQIRGYPIQFDIDVLVLFSANPTTYNRSGKVIPQLKDRIGSLIQTHYPLERSLGIEITEQEAGLDLAGEYPVFVPYFMKEIIEQISIAARRSKYVDHASGVSARFSIANYRTMVASARHRGVKLGEDGLEFLSVHRLTTFLGILPSTVPVTPLPVIDAKLVASASAMPRAVAPATIAAARGCSLLRSRLAASRSS